MDDSIKAYSEIISPYLLAFCLTNHARKKAHLAIVYKDRIKSGIVTMETIFEEIIGDIYDEDDDQHPLNSIHFKKH